MTNVKITFQEFDTRDRQCGGCSLCCKLLPMKTRPPDQIARVTGEMIKQGWAKASEFVGMLPDFNKPANQPCQHQRHGKGCKVYARRPSSCRWWSCRWLVNNDTADLRRPDRSRYVIDILPDFVTLQDNDTGQSRNVEIVQVWVDPATPDAWRDPALLAYIERRAEEGIAALIRWGSGSGMTVFAPAMSADKQWHEVRGASAGREHLADELIEGLAACAKVKVG